MPEHTATAHTEHAPHYDPEACRMGMWLFLFTEVLLFGTLFIGFAVYLYEYRHAFHVCSGELDLALGAVNTVILLTSSLTVVLAIAALERARKGLAVGLLLLTVACATAFLGIKYLEWSSKFAHHLYPGSPVFADREPGDAIFYGFYFTMTGFHAFHVVVGMIVILTAAGFILAGKISRERSVFLENTGLYWHLVDIIWIYLFPLFYLLG